MWCRFGLAGLCLCLLVTAQETPEAKWAERRRLYPKLASLYDLAGTAPEPLKALAYQKIASAPELRDAVWRRELLEDTFEIGQRAPLPWPVNYVAMPEGPTSVPVLPARMAQASQRNVGLDRLTLQAGAVSAMSRVDGLEARQLFARMGTPALEVVSCKESLIPNVVQYYLTAGKLASGAFSEDERAKREDLHFLEAVIAGVRFPEQVRPATEMLRDAKISPEDLDVLVVALARQVAAITPDSRAFADGLRDTDVGLNRLIDQLAGRPTAGILWTALRSYLVTNLTATACKESVEPRYVYRRWAREAVNRFNEKSVAGISLNDIEEREMTPSRVEAGLEPDAKTTDRTTELSPNWFVLAFGNQRTALSEAQKNTAEWKSAFSDYLNKVEALRVEDGISSADLLWRKCELMAAAAMVAPPGDEKAHAMRRYIELLNMSDLPADRVSQWYSQVRSFLSLSRMFSPGSDWLNEEVTRSGGSMLHLVISLESLDGKR